MVNFIKNIENKDILTENFSEDELRTIAGSINVLIHIYSSELERLSKEKRFNSSNLTEEELDELDIEIMSCEDDIVELNKISFKLDSILNNFKHLN